ncbi:MMPL family transporter [Tenuifilum thalassicum]|uniref:MMPL family transporter n=2 Tax=Tenuifilum thalassicum TaxID=2590900 RepID=A0A7D3XMI0_9BACT|nr:MMPL family transporter [Tenuifilum thalassicum]
MFHHLARFILKRRFLLISLLFLFTLYMGWMATKVKLSYKPAPLLPKTDSILVQNEMFSKLFGKGENIMVIGVTDSLFFEKDNLSSWFALEKNLKNKDGVENIFSITDIITLAKDTLTKKFVAQKLFASSNLPESDSLSRLVNSLPFYEGLLYNSETHTYLMLITLNRELITKVNRIRIINGILDECKVYEKNTGNQLHYSGLPYIRAVVAEMIKFEMFLFVALAVLATSLILYFLFRSFRIIFISLVVVGTSVIWSLGSLTLLGYDLTLLTAVVPPLLIIIGVPNCIYLINKYHHEIAHHKNKMRALFRVIYRIGSATFLTNLTTALGFVTFVFTKTQILREFGLVAFLNILGIFVISLIIIPFFFSITPLPKQRHLKHLNRTTFKQAISRIVMTVYYKRKWVFVVTVVTIVFGLVGASMLKANGYMVDDVPRNHPVQRDLKFFERHFTGIMPLEIVLNTGRPNGFQNYSNYQKIDRLQKELEKYPELSKPFSIVELAKFARQAYYNGNKKQYRLPGPFERAFIMSYIPRSIGVSDMYAKMVDSTGQYMRIMYNVADVGSQQMGVLFDSINNDIQQVFGSDSKNVSITGASVVTSYGIKYLVHSLTSSLFLAILLIAIAIAWLFRKFKMVLFAIGINFIPLILTAATMGYFGINLKPSTVIVFSIALGIAVDNSIHFLTKYRQELYWTGFNVKESIFHAIRETGISMIYTSIVLLFGFSVFIASSFGGTKSLGLLVAITLLYAVVTNLFVLPSILRQFDKPKPSKPSVDEEIVLEMSSGFDDEI